VDWLKNLDRRWIFLAMFIAVAVPVLLRWQLPEAPTPIVRSVFDAIENLPEGSRVAIAFDYDPASRPELGPMALAFTRHCAERKHQMFMLTLWPAGGPMVQEAIDVLEREFGDEYTYGRNYINLGFAAGNEAVIKLIATDIVKQYPLDAGGRATTSFPIMRGVRNMQDMDLVISIGAGYPGTKEWVQYLSTPFPDVKIVAGVTGVSAPYLYPYVPAQLVGMLPAIKGAAEYEATLSERYPQYDDPQYQQALMRMGPQLSAHILMLLLIILGNVIFVLERRRGGVR
jgi:hypothetical protein